jgi:parafibromin
MSTTDPLNLLRGAISSGQLPSLLDANDESCPLVQATKISFASTDAGTITLPITTPTRFTVRENDTSEFHTLQQLYYVYVERETGGAEYMRKAQAVVGGMRVVSIINRRLVLDYLEGKTEAPKGRVVVQGSDPAQPGECAWAMPSVHGP